MAAKIVDNNRLRLADALIQAAPRFKKISIATGYWDLPGFQLLRDALKNYESVRILIGQEPLPPAYAKRLDLNELDETFPEIQMKESLASLENKQELREAAKTLKEWINEGRVEVKIYRGNFLHAKTYILGDEDSAEAIGVIGSSNFTAAGLTRNLELNALEDDVLRVAFQPQNDLQPHGHLSWFNSIWNDENSEDWNGKFTQILESSPMGDITFSQYHMYIKALYEIYGDELVGDLDLNQDLEQILYAFQSRNAKLLQQKLERAGVAILADSVGLGKTITAGAVLKTYIEEKDAGRIYIIAPASLTQQWSKELGEMFKLVTGFEILSLQDAQKIKDARELDQYAPVDLFIVDEAHNLRSGSGSRFDELLEWFSDNPDSHVLLLTATPINNSLKDLKNQIQLGSKGKLHSVPVVYPTDARVEVIDFFEAIERLNKEIKSAITAGKTPDYDKVNKVMKQGLRPYLVRTTRSGIMKEFGGIKAADGTMLKFPDSINKPRGYEFDSQTSDVLRAKYGDSIDVFGGLPLKDLDLTWLLRLTQRTEHPIDSILRAELEGEKAPDTPFEIIFAVLLTLGFAPYRGDVYRNKYYGKELDKISYAGVTEEEKLKVSSQFSIHNMLRVTLLKRLESSQYALRLSIENYGKRLVQFRRLLETGHIGRIKDLNAVIDLFGDDVNENQDLPEDIKSEFDMVVADPAIFNLEALKRDLDRDATIIEVLLAMCDVLAADDDKLQSFAKLLNELQAHEESGKKVLVFSYYADTIAYLQSEIGKHVNIQDFETRSAFVVGGNRNQANDLAKRFSPISKKATPELMAQGELDFLFATDVLSEGQNLQDCGVIVNFDLHWNPVRMIQRNGRINRLGSTFDEVFIFNMHPDKGLNEYLTLVERLNNKIDQIKFSIGTDQSVLGEEANPKEFVDVYNPDSDGQILDQEDDEAELLGEDEFVRELREFDANASDDEKNLVKNIGMGKWGYLPAHYPQFIKAAQALALVRVGGTFNHNGESFRNHVFIRKAEHFSPISSFSALSALRVSKNASDTRTDKISIDRDEVIRKANQLAKHHAAKPPLYFKRTPKVNEAIGIFAKYKQPGMDLDLALDKVQTKQTLKRAGQIVRLINKENKAESMLSEATIATVEAFINHMSKFDAVGITLDKNSIQGVLYFAS